MLRRDEVLPVVHRLGPEMRARVADEVPEDVLLEIRFGMRRAHAAKPSEAGKQRVLRIRAASIDARVAPAARDRIRLRGRCSIDQLAEAVNDYRAYAHVSAARQEQCTQ